VTKAPDKLKVIVIGADGQLGSDMVAACRAAGHETLPLTLAQMDIADGGQVQRTLAGAGADVIINTAAMHQVEKCEADPARAFAVNALGARDLSLAAKPPAPGWCTSAPITCSTAPSWRPTWKATARCR